ncbi:MAG: ABC transporter permease subunit [Paracoccaceae bacterium]
MPALALGLGLMAHLTRMTRATMTGILSDQEFIRVARAKGLGERTVIWRYGLANAVRPVMTVAGSRNAQRRMTLKNPMSITPYLPEQNRQGNVFTWVNSQ